MSTASSLNQTPSASPLSKPTSGETPVLTPEAPPFKQRIHSEQGALYEPGNLDDMEQKLEKLLDTELNPRSEASRYSLENTVDRLEKLYRQVA